ncbi:hypothetical protein, partial [Anaerotignum lactatifermentans]|uniref:hypothetical protein n=1 Tax=Anaerotignum lactatifermentans TaxID=160404 RepID=UPI003AB3BEBF
INPKRASPDQLLPYHKKISAEGKAQMICFISYTYMVLKRPHFNVVTNQFLLSISFKQTPYFAILFSSIVIKIFLYSSITVTYFKKSLVYLCFY